MGGRQPRRPEYHVVVAGQAICTFEPGANGLAHHAARAVSTHQVFGVDGQHFAGMAVPGLGRHPVIVLGEAGQCTVEAQFDAGQRLRVRAHHLFHRVLGNPLRMFRIQRIATRRAIKRVLEPRQFVPCQPGAEHHVGWVVHAQRRGGAQAVGDTPAPEVLAGAHVRGLGARGMTDPVVALDQQAWNLAMPELDRQCQANRSGADDQHPGAQCHWIHVSPPVA